MSRMTKLYVGDLREDVTKEDIEKVFGPYGELRQVWMSHGSAGYAFVDFEDPRDAEDAARALDRRTVLGSRIRVEFSRGGRHRQSSGDDHYSSKGRLRRPFNPSDLCYECGQPGHYAYDCEIRIRRMRNARAYNSPSPYRRRNRRSSSSRRGSSRRRYRSRSRTPPRRYRSRSYGDTTDASNSTHGLYDRTKKSSRSSSRSSYDGDRYKRKSISRTPSTSPVNDRRRHRSGSTHQSEERNNHKMKRTPSTSPVEERRRHRSGSSHQSEERNDRKLKRSPSTSPIKERRRHRSGSSHQSEERNDRKIKRSPSASCNRERRRHRSGSSHQSEERNNHKMDRTPSTSPVKERRHHRSGSP